MAQIGGDASLQASRIKEATFIDVTETTAQVKVVREGFQVPVVELNKTAQFKIDNLPTVVDEFLPRVVSQSIAAGTRVPLGTVVDLVVAPKGIIPFAIVDNVHADLATHTLSQVDDLV